MSISGFSEHGQRRSAGYYSKERLARFVRYTPHGARIVEVAKGSDLLAKAMLFVESQKIHLWAGGYDRYADKKRGLSFSSVKAIT